MVCPHLEKILLAPMAKPAINFQLMAARPIQLLRHEFVTVNLPNDVVFCRHTVSVTRIFAGVHS